MAMTPAERQKKRREKLKREGKYEEYKQRHREHSKKHENKLKEKLKKLPANERNLIEKKRRQEVKIRVAKCRLLKKINKKTPVNASESPSKTIYNSAQALGKAVSRAKHALPSSPRHRRTVIKKLFVDSGCSSSREIYLQANATNKNSLSGETVLAVKNFYNQDDVSTMSAGRRDAVLDGGGSKTKIQVRYMICSVSEAFQQFKEQNPDIVVGKSKFAELRPSHVLLSSKLPHNVCLCKYHQNYALALESLHKVNPNIPKYSTKFVDGIICRDATRNCWFNKCDTCKDGKGFLQFIGDIEEKDVTWFIWKSEETDRIHKVLEEGCTTELVEYICSVTPQFLEHSYIKRHQAECYRNIRKDVDKPSFKCKALIQVDFAENYTCVSQDEIQSAHWQQSQISLFTAAVWHSGKLHPFVLASDNLTHTKDTIIAYIDILLATLPSTIKQIFVWSDGPSSQFKNRYIAAALPTLCRRYNFAITWNFFATSHGKGPVDGIGGAVKRKVWNAVKQRKLQVTCADDFAKAYNNSEEPNVKVLPISSTVILQHNNELGTNQIIKSAKTVEGISRVHCIRASIETFTTSILTDDEGQNEFPQNFIKVGDWYYVQYDGELYPGVVNEIKDDEFKVSTMERAGCNWKWPSSPDEIYYTIS